MERCSGDLQVRMVRTVEMGYDWVASEQNSTFQEKESEGKTDTVW